MKDLLKQMIAGTSLEPIAMRVHAALYVPCAEVWAKWAYGPGPFIAPRPVHKARQSVAPVRLRVPRESVRMRADAGAVTIEVKEIKRELAQALLLGEKTGE